MHRYQQKGEVYKNSTLNSANVSKCFLIVNQRYYRSSKIYVYAQKLFNPAITTKNTKHIYPTLPKAIDYMQKIDREFPCVEAIQQTEFQTVKPISTYVGNDPMKQQ